jgi:biofilm PGA synthesis N-glycosyltransferase PgaC
MSNVQYIIIAPVRDEAEHVQRMIESVASQTMLPAKLVLVNDGSTDGTGQIIDEAAKRHSWIETVDREDRGARQAGGGVVEAVYAGLKLLEGERWEYLVKLDGDVSFEPWYFERCFAHFAAEPRLGIAGGLVCNIVNGGLTAESKVDPVFHVRGATKIYRRACWQEIGGLVSAPGWDTVDELKANMLGWSTRTFPDIKIVHHRFAGAAYGTWRNWVKNGHANYVAAYHPLFMLLKCVSRIHKKPYGIAALGLWVGFCGGYVKRMWRVDDPSFVRYFRGQQLRRILGRPSLWGSGR